MSIEATLATPLEILHNRVFYEVKNNVLPEIITHIILDYAVEPKKKFVDWIDINKFDRIDIWLLSENPAAIDFLIDNPWYINWEHMCSMKSKKAMELLRKNMDKIKWVDLSANPYAVDLLLSNPEKVDWFMLSSNPSDEAFELLLKRYGEIEWDMLSSNSCDKAVDLLLSNPNKIDWNNFGQNTNPRAIAYMRQHPDKIHWSTLNLNSSDTAVDLLLSNPSEIRWHIICYNINPRILKYLVENEPNYEHIISSNFLTNPHAIDYFKKNQDKIHWSFFLSDLLSNPAIFEVDHEGFMTQKKDLVFD